MGAVKLEIVDSKSLQANMLHLSMVTIGLNQIVEVKEEWFDDTPWAEMFWKRMELVKESI